MTAPRQVLPHATMMITRRCLNRMFLLRPSAVTNDVFRFVLAVAAQRHQVQIHAYCVLSNHFHCVLTDTQGNLPAFEQYLDSLVARALNALHGRWETFWAPGSYSAVRLVSPEDILAKMAYVLANPAAAGLVRRGEEWPGLWSRPELLGHGPVEVKRPDHFFRPGGPLPESASLELTCPPGFESTDTLRVALRAEVAALEDAAARRLGKEGRGFLGAPKVLAQRPDARPSGGEPRRGTNPRVACQDTWKRAEAIVRLKEFLVAYRHAWEAFAQGIRDTVFPEGTYWMRVAYGVHCTQSGAAA